MVTRAVQQHEMGQHPKDVPGDHSAPDRDREARAAVLVDHGQQLQRPALVCALEKEVMIPSVVPPLLALARSRPIVEPQAAMRRPHGWHLEPFGYPDMRRPLEPSGEAAPWPAMAVFRHGPRTSDLAQVGLRTNRRMACIMQSSRTDDLSSRHQAMRKQGARPATRPSTAGSSVKNVTARAPRLGLLARPLRCPRLRGSGRYASQGPHTHCRNAAARGGKD